MAEHSKALSELSMTEPLSGPVPTGLEIAYSVNPTTSSQAIGRSLKEAATTLGWTVKEIQQGSDPSAVASAMKLAAKTSPDAAN